MKNPIEEILSFVVVLILFIMIATMVLSCASIPKDEVVPLKGEWKIAYEPAPSSSCHLVMVNRNQDKQLITVTDSSILVNFELFNEEEGKCYQYHTVGEYPITFEEQFITETELVKRLNKYFTTNSDVLDFGQNLIKIREGNNTFTLTRIEGNSNE